MKKVLSILLVVAAMLPVLSVGASAAQVMEGTASSTITFRQPSTYSIYIPETLTENETGMYQFTAEHINITADEKIFVCKVRGKFRNQKLTPLVGDVVRFDEEKLCILEIRTNYFLIHILWQHLFPV